jgi:hypothetical protein
MKHSVKIKWVSGLNTDRDFETREEVDNYLKDLDWESVRSCIEITEHKKVSQTNVLLTIEWDKNRFIPPTVARFTSSLIQRDVLNELGGQQNQIPNLPSHLFEFDPKHQNEFEDENLYGISIKVVIDGPKIWTSWQCGFHGG